MRSSTTVPPMDRPLPSGGPGAASVAQRSAASSTASLFHFIYFERRTDYFSIAANRNRAEGIRERGNWTRKRNNTLRTRIAGPETSNAGGGHSNGAQANSNGGPGNSNGGRDGQPAPAQPKRGPLPESRRRGRSRAVRGLSRSPTPGSTDHELEPNEPAQEETRTCPYTHTVGVY